MADVSVVILLLPPPGINDVHQVGNQDIVYMADGFTSKTDTDVAMVSKYLNRNFHNFIAKIVSVEHQCHSY